MAGGDTLLEFPCDFPLKIMGATRDDFAQAISRPPTSPIFLVKPPLRPRPPCAPRGPRRPVWLPVVARALAGLRGCARPDSRSPRE
jgi:hypothetical protein